MPTPQEIEAKFWSALKSDRTMMLGLADLDEGHTRPMTAQIRDEEGGPIWFFASSDNALVENLGDGARAVGAFASKNHGVFASIHGELSLDTNPDIIDELWNPYVAAWYEGGKSDPKLRLLRLDPDQAELWLDGSSVLAGLKLLIGIDPKEDYKDNAAKLRLDM